MSGAAAPAGAERRRWWRPALGLAGAAAIAAGVVLAQRQPPPPERIVLIVVDTLRADHAPPHASSDAAPNLARLAARGQVFPDAIASFHQTSMSMAALFTGRTPSIESGDPGESLHWNGSTWCGLSRFAAEADDASCLPAPVLTVAERLREAGYWTIGIASNAFLYEPSGFAQGFDDWVEVRDGAVQGVDLGSFRDSPPARRWKPHWQSVHRAALEALQRRPDDRFFLYVHYMDVHDNSVFGGGDPGYATAVQVVDGAVGLLLQRLDEAGLLDGAVVIFTSDHGERLEERHALAGRPGHLGNPSFQEVLRVPLIVAPSVVEDASGVWRSEDVHYLIQEIAGLRPERRPELEPGELYLAERHFRTYLRGRWKSTARRGEEALHLFDLAADPGERRDVAEAHPAVVAAHRRRIDELARQLAAPNAPVRELSPLDRARLDALGYLE